MKHRTHGPLDTFQRTPQTNQTHRTSAAPIGQAHAAHDGAQHSSPERFSASQQRGDARQGAERYSQEAARRNEKANPYTARPVFNQPMGRHAPQNGPRQGRAVPADSTASTCILPDGTVVTRKRRRKRHHKNRTRIAIVLALVLVLVGGMGYAGFQFYKSVQNVKSTAYYILDSTSTLKQDASSGDTDAVRALSQDIASKSTAMHTETEGLLWNAASAMPVYGGDVVKVQAIASALDDFSSNALVPLATSLPDASLASLVRSDRSIDVAALQKTLSAVGDTAPAVKRTAALLNSLNAADSHYEPLNAAIAKAQADFSALDSAFTEAQTVAPLIPALLGANGTPRNYLILSENSVEVRATGGFVGAVCIVNITDGKVSLDAVDNTSAAFTPLPESSAPTITAEESNLFKNNNWGNFNTYIGDTTVDPDYSRAAQIAQEIWANGGGTHIDGVIALDPVCLESILKVTGGISMPDGSTLDGTTAARVLMHDVYWNLSNAEQDEYFAEAAEGAFQKLFASIDKNTLQPLATTFDQNIKSRRLQIWLAQTDEQSILQKMGWTSGVSLDPTAPVAGVYLNDMTTSKIDWYLKLDTHIDTPTNNTDGTKSYRMSVSLKNELTDAEASTAPRYVTGYDSRKTAVGDMITQVFLYAPAGGSISNVDVNGTLALDSGTYNGLQVLCGTSHTLPGATTSITYTVTTSAKALKPLAAQATNTAQEVAGWN